MIKHFLKNKIVIEVDKNTIIKDFNDICDMVSTVSYQENIVDVAVAIYKESLNPDFFILKTKYAGELLQKCTNYQINIAIIGDFSAYSSKSLKDFIREANKGNSVSFINRIEEYLDKVK